MIKTFIKRDYLERLVLEARAKGYSWTSIGVVLDKLNPQIREG